MELQETVRKYEIEQKNEGIETEQLVRSLFETLGQRQRFFISSPYHISGFDGWFKGTVQKVNNSYDIYVDPEGVRVEIRYEKLPNPEYENKDLGEIVAVLKLVFGRQ